MLDVFFTRSVKGLGNTKEKLKAAIAGEDYETTTMYPDFAKTARREGNQQAVTLFKQLTKVEADHRDYFSKTFRPVGKGHPESWQK